MKKTTLIFCLVSLTVGLSFSQGKLLILGGVNSSFIGGVDVREIRTFYKKNLGAESSFNILPKTGMNFGVKFQYDFNEKVGFETGLIYQNKGYVYRSHYKISENSVSFSDPNDSLYIEIDENQIYRLRLNYIDFPIGLTYQLNKKIQFTGGLFLGLRVASKEKYIYRNNLNGEKDKEVYEIDKRDEYKRVVFGLYVGAHYTLKKNWGIALNISKTGKIQKDYLSSFMTISLSLVKTFNVNMNFNPNKPGDPKKNRKTRVIE